MGDLLRRFRELCLKCTIETTEDMQIFRCSWSGSNETPFTALRSPGKDAEEAQTPIIGGAGQMTSGPCDPPERSLEPGAMGLQGHL